MREVRYVCVSREQLALMRIAAHGGRIDPRLRTRLLDELTAQLGVVDGRDRPTWDPARPARQEKGTRDSKPSN